MVPRKNAHRFDPSFIISFTEWYEKKIESWFLQEGNDAQFRRKILGTNNYFIN